MESLVETRIDNANFTAYGKSFIGGRSENQDCFDLQSLRGNGALATVCDGMGGAAGGAIASAAAVKAIVDYLKSAVAIPNSLETTEDQLHVAVERANDAIYQEAIANAALRGMGSTATIALFNAEAAYVTHVGDSRIYQIRGGQKVFRTFDHSRVFEMVKAKNITEEEARQRPDSNVITRVLGVRPTVEAEISKLAYKKGDRFILCCDGVWNSMPELELLQLFTASPSPQATVEQVIATVDKIGQRAGGGHDNATIIIVDVKADSHYQPTLWHKMKSYFKKKPLYPL